MRKQRFATLKLVRTCRLLRRGSRRSRKDSTVWSHGKNLLGDALDLLDRAVTAETEERRQEHPKVLVELGSVEHDRDRLLGTEESGDRHGDLENHKLVGQGDATDPHD